MAKNKKLPETTPQEGAEVHNIEEVLQLEQRDRRTMTISDKIADRITAFSGSMLYVGIHIIWFGGWILLNGGWFLPPFDPFPFSLLTMVVSLEAIFLSAFVLISQNKQALQADRRAKIDLQVNMLAEQETTKLIQMVEEIHRRLDIQSKGDQEVKTLLEKIDINKIADELDEAEQEGSDEEHATATSRHGEDAHT